MSITAQLVGAFAYNHDFFQRLAARYRKNAHVGICPVDAFNTFYGLMIYTSKR